MCSSLGGLQCPKAVLLSQQRPGKGRGYKKGDTYLPSKGCGKRGKSRFLRSHVIAPETKFQQKTPQPRMAFDTSKKHQSLVAHQDSTSPGFGKNRTF